MCFSTFAVRASSLTSMTALLFELERITPTRVTTPRDACDDDWLHKELPPDIALSVFGRQCLMASQGEASQGEAVFHNRIRRDMMLAMRGAWGLAATAIQGDVFLVIVL